MSMMLAFWNVPPAGAPDPKSELNQKLAAQFSKAEAGAGANSAR